MLQNFESNASNNPPPHHHPQYHHGHRVIDVTAVGNIHPRRLCLDCHLEYEERQPERSTEWIQKL